MLCTSILTPRQPVNMQANPTVAATAKLTCGHGRGFCYRSSRSGSSIMTGCHSTSSSSSGSRGSGGVGDKGSSGESDSPGSSEERRIIAGAHRVDCAVGALPSLRSDSRSGACFLLDFSLATATSDKKEGISEAVINSPTIRNRAAPKKPRTDTDRRDRGGREWWPAAAVTAARPHRGCLGAPGPAPGRMDLLRMALGFGVRPLWCEPESTLPLAAARSLASDHNCAGVKTAGMATAGAGRQLGSLHCAPSVLLPASWDVLAGDDCSGCTADRELL